MAVLCRAMVRVSSVGCPRLWHVLICSLISMTAAAAYAQREYISPFPLSQITLHLGSQFDKAFSLNKQYMQSIDPDRLLHSFRLNAGLNSTVEPFSGSWEDPTCEVRGQFMGHYLSGGAMLVNYTGDESFHDRLEYLIEELSKVQEVSGDGYLSAFPKEHFTRLQSLQAVWAPFYVVHKIIAGLLDAYTFLGSQLALDMVVKEAEYFVAYHDHVAEVNGTTHWVKMLDNEFGGMAETLFKLYDITGDRKHWRLGEAFIKPSFYGPLVQDKDPLGGLHANTHLAQVNSFAAQFETAGNSSSFAAVNSFYNSITSRHSFATGGSNDHEYWGPSLTMADAIMEHVHGTETQETCTQYNILKVARYLFRWSGAPSFADFYERAILNGLFGVLRMPANYEPHGHDPARNHHTSSPVAPFASGPNVSWPSVAADLNTANWRQGAHLMYPGVVSADGADGSDNDPGPGVLVYLTPMGAGQTKGDSSHSWGSPLHSFWCCYGSAVESFSKVADSIFFHRETEGEGLELYINQLVSASLASPRVGLLVNQTASLYGPNFTATANITFSRLATGQESSGKLLLKLRIPSWLDEARGASVMVNGKAWAGCQAAAGHMAGSFCTVERNFTAGDSIRMMLPMSVRAERVQDSRANYSTIHAVMMGPLVMAGLTDGPRQIQADPSAVAGLLSEVPAGGLVEVNLKEDASSHLRCAGRKVEIAGKGTVPSLYGSWQLRQVHDGDKGPAVLLSGGDGPRWALESASSPGLFLDLDNQGRLVLGDYEGSGWERTLAGELLGSSSSRLPRLTLQGPLPQTLAGSTGGLSTPGEPGTSILVTVVPAAAQYPEGAKRLTGIDREYIVAPLMSIIEEAYTVYLDFQHPSTDVNHQALAPGQRPVHEE